MNKTFAFSLAASALLATPAFAAAPSTAAALPGDCSKIEKTLPVTMAEGPRTGPYPVLVGLETLKIDQAKHSLCYAFQNNGFLGTKITPKNLCVDLAKKPAKDPKVTFTFAGGKKIDATAHYGFDATLKNFVLLTHRCENLGGDNNHNMDSLPPVWRVSMPIPINWGPSPR